jgi:hypothetical protein
LIHRYSFDEIGLMGALSFGQAASTLAIAQVGLTLGFFGQDVVNGAIFASVATALTTAMASRYFIKRLPPPVTPPAAVGERVLVDARPSSSNLQTVMDFAGRIAVANGGVITPFSVLGSPRLEVGRTHVAEAEVAAASAGHDASGIVRVSESFSTGALELTVENEATLTVLPWTRPQFGSSYVFGSELDRFGAQSPAPTVAVQLLAPWRRVVLVLAEASVAWHLEDARLAADLAQRVVDPDEGGLLVLARDSDEITETLAAVEGVEVRLGRIRPGELLDELHHDDLLILPAYIVQENPVAVQLRMSRSLAHNDVAIVAGPYRMTIARAESRRMERIVGHGRA